MSLKMMLSSFIPAAWAKAVLPPELLSRLECQLIPEEGTRSELKNALFAAYELGMELYEAQMVALRHEFAGHAKEYFFNTTKLQPPIFDPILLMDRTQARGMSVSKFRKIYGSSGQTTVLWDKSKGMQFYDDS